MKLKSQYLVVLLIMSLISSLFVGCSGNSQPVQSAEGDEQSSESTFIIARSTDATTLDTGFSYSESDIDSTNHMFEGLVRYKNDDLEVEPSLAKDWSTSDDGKIWTFYLREGVKFHDGTEFDADSVVFSFMRLKDENHPYYGLGSYSAFTDYIAAPIKDVKAIDKYTVEFVLNDVYAPFLTYLGFYSQFIVSPTAVEKYGGEFYKNPVGTGPYKLDEWKRDEYIQMSRFEDYWGDKPSIETIIWKVVPEDSTRLMELQTGQVHAIKNITPSQLETIKEDENIEFIQIPGASLFFASINHGIKPFNDVRVRQAICHAIDLDTLVEGIYEGLGTRAINPMPPTILGFNKDVKPYEYNIEKAKELLAQAGYPDGFEMDIHVFPEPRIYVGRPVDSAEIIKNDLSKVGIKANIVVNEWATHLDIYQKEEHQFSLIGWYDIPYPSNFLKIMLLDSAHNKYNNQELRDLADEALSTYDESVQVENYERIQKIAHEDVAILPIAHSDYTAAILKTVKGFRLDPLGHVYLTKASL